MKNNDLRTLTRLALLVAIELVMKAIGLGSVPVGPLYMSFLTLPIAVGAITMGPAAGAILGGVFGATSFIQCFGMDTFGTTLFGINPVYTAIMCFVPRILMGLFCGLIYKAFGKKNYIKTGTALTSFCGGFINTVLFVGALLLLFFLSSTVFHLKCHMPAPQTPHLTILNATP